MNCTDARRRLLIADLAVVRGDADLELRDHLRGCAACAADAQRILRGTALLGHALRKTPATSRGRLLQRVAWMPVSIAAAMLIMVANHQPTDVRALTVDSLPGLVTTLSDGDSDLVSEARSVDSAKELANRAASAGDSGRRSVHAGGRPMSLVHLDAALLRQAPDYTKSRQFALAANRPRR
jgi:hypothetical protein